MGYAVNKQNRVKSCCRFLVGRTLEGDWIVCDRKRLVGGIFADRQSAVHFAASQSEHLPGAVWCANDEDCLITDPWADMKPVLATAVTNASCGRGRMPAAPRRDDKACWRKRA